MATINVHDFQAARGFNYAKRFCDHVIVEKYITGKDFRVLIINYKIVATALRKHAQIVGDAKHTLNIIYES